MATVPILDFPDIIPDVTEWALLTNTQIFTSPLSGDTQTVTMPGARWAASLTFDNLTPSTARELMAFLVKLKGPAGRFYLYDHTLPDPRGIAGTAGTYAMVDGANQVGDTIDTKGWTVSQSNMLLAGDYFQIGDELKMITETAASDSGGLSTLTFEPPIRNSPADSSNIILEKPMCVMRLIDDEQIRWSNAESILLSGITFACEEVFFNG